MILKDHDTDHFHISDMRHRLNCDLKDLENNLVICPLRHPRRVKESWVRRAGDLKQFYGQWEHLMDVFSEYIDFYVRVDHESRDEELDLLPIEVNRDWSVTEVSGSRHGTHQISLKNCPDVPGDFIAFYESPYR